MAALLESARQELAPAKPEQFKIFLLAAMAGLRRNEIDKLPSTAFCWNDGLIRIQATEFFRPKSHESEEDVLVDALLELFRGFYARRKTNSSSSRTSSQNTLRPSAAIGAKMTSAL